LAAAFWQKPTDPQEVVSDIGARMLRLVERINRRNPNPRDIIERWQAYDHSKGIKLTSPSLMACTDGLLPGEFWVIGAFSSTGKTAFALQMLREVLDKGKAAIFFSLEMSQEQLMHRMIANRSRVPMWKIRYQENLTTDDWRDINQAEADIADCQGRLWLYDDTYTLAEISHLCRKHRLQGALDVVFVDYLQNLRGSGERRDILGDGANQLLSLAKQLQCTVVALSQITTGQAMLNMGDNETYSFKDSGGIRDAADKAIILSRDRKEQENGASTGVLTVKIKKNRTGTLGEVKMQFDFTTGRIWEASNA
jgi:replicative DNA helicase